MASHSERYPSPALDRQLLPFLSGCEADPAPGVSLHHKSVSGLYATHHGLSQVISGLMDARRAQPAGFAHVCKLTSRLSYHLPLQLKLFNRMDLNPTWWNGVNEASSNAPKSWTR